MIVFFITKCNSIPEATYRVGPMHSSVFHGAGHFPKTDSDEDLLTPSVTNENREMIHITRSHAIFPDVFFAGPDLIVSEKVAEKICGFKGVGLNLAYLEKLVDVAMPPFGDFSWLDRDDLHLYEGDSLNYLRSRPASDPVDKVVPKYFHVLVPSRFTTPKEYNDIRKITVNYGSCSRKSRLIETEVSPGMMEDYSMLRIEGICMKEEVFEAIAPFLDLDFINIARANTEPRPEPYNPFAD